MTKLALTIPQFGNIPNFPDLGKKGSGLENVTTLGGITSSLLDIVFMISAFLAFFWFVWGAFQYIFAGGNQESLTKAKARMTWSVVGLLIVAAAFLISQFAGEILKPRNPPPISLVPTVYAAVDIGEQYDFGHIKTLGQGVQLLVKPAFALATVAVIAYFMIAAIKLLSPGANKDTLTESRRMMTHGIAGFILLMLAFLIFNLVFQAFGIPFSLF